MEYKIHSCGTRQAIMKILSLERVGSLLIGYRESDKYYIKFEINKKDEVIDIDEFKIFKYRNYLHFVGVIGKFNPYTQFFKNPVDLKVLSYNALTKILEQQI